MLVRAHGAPRPRTSVFTRRLRAPRHLVEPLPERAFLAAVSHFAVLSPPLYSHVRALEALASELVARGHRVTWVAQADVAPLLRDARVGFEGVGLASHPRGSLAAQLARLARPGGPLGLLRVIRDMAAQTDMLCREGRQVLPALQVDSVISDQMEAAGGLLAEGLGLPCISVACALPVNREPQVPLPVMPWPYARDIAAVQRNQVSARIHDWLMAPLGRVIAEQARHFRLGHRTRLDECLSPLLQLSQTTAGFDFPRSALPAHFHPVGPLRPPGVAHEVLAQPVQPGAPFVYASLGTMQGGRYRLFEHIAHACRAVGAQLLVTHCGGLRPTQEERLRRAGATWVTDQVPQAAALARADVAVTHAGLNTVLDALVAGTPMLALPIAFDQPGVAARVRESGTGLVASARGARAATLQRLLETLLGDGAYAARAERLGHEVAQAGGVTRAADLIEAALGSAAATHAPAPAQRDAHAA